MSVRDLHCWSPTIRVGMPLVSGRLLELGLATGLPLLFSANAFSRVDANKEFIGFRVDAARRLPESLDAALDSAGFTASVAYPDYRWTLDQYLDLVASRPWRWAACPDYCVEPQIAADAAVRRLRIDATITNHYRTTAAARKRGITVPILPVLQGWYAQEYVECARSMFGDMGSNWPALIGIGSVCRRQLHGPAGVLTIMRALDEVMPEGVAVHLFGVKSGALAALAPLANRVASIDSMSWDMQARRAMHTGRTQEMRAETMAAWHARQVQALHEVQQRPAPMLPVALAAHAAEPLEIALNAAGASLAQLYESNDLSYLDVKTLTAQSAYVVEALIRNRGPLAFEDEEPQDDFELGIVYAAVRDALIACGHLEEIEIA
jgi:hypothetical protein